MAFAVASPNSRELVASLSNPSNSFGC